MTKEELLALIETKVAQQGNQGASELAEILKEIVTNGIEPTVIDFTTLDSGETYTADELAEIGLTTEVTERILKNPSAFVVKRDANTYVISYARPESADSAFIIVAGYNGATTEVEEADMLKLYGDATEGYTFVIGEF